MSPLTLLFCLFFFFFNGETSFQKNLDYPFPVLKLFLHYVAPCDGVGDVLQMFRGFTLFQHSLDQSMANGRTVLPWYSQLQVHWTAFHVKANYG